MTAENAKQGEAVHLCEPDEDHFEPVNSLSDML
jgi:hypothetical protein